MRKFCALVFFSLLTLNCDALPVFNPADASLYTKGFFFCNTCCSDDDEERPPLRVCDCVDVRVGYYFDSVYNRHLVTTRLAHVNVDDQLEKVCLSTNAALVTVNFFDRLDLFTTLGATHYFEEFNGGIFGFPGERLKFDTNTQFSWSVGGRLTIWNKWCTYLGIEGQYFRVKPDIIRVEVGDVSAIYPNFPMKYDEWQIGVGVAHRINLLVPYFAVKYSRVHRDIPAYASEVKEAKHWGYAVGVTLLMCESIGVTTEVRLADEKALAVNGQFRF